ncbi:WD40 repeat-like protein [Lentinus tigrinus ALCF2SS1-6]|uniref:WD40 repeat-like protein n=2 Tax=Lentinus tigrinus TaxID=5365 RepID=A0A5C2RXR5_9APHY|nr:WD40 repeat-like protein [Lentinus tigrinus ALCF2SS1-6]
MPDRDPFRISADEINYLIYAYFKDSGFSHSAFVLRAESKLERSTFYGKSVPRGELVELLAKALLYSEVEAHWKGNNMSLSCTNKFGLLEPHVCSYDPQLPPPPPPVSQRIPLASVQPQAHAHGFASASSDPSLKRKASGMSSSEDNPPEKKTRTDGTRDGGVDVRSTSSVEPRPSASRASSSAPDHANTGSDLATVKSNGTSALLDPGEHPDSPVRLLRGHKAEVFVCAWNPVNHSALASGSKDSLVHIWNVPGPDADGNVPTSIDPPIVCAYAAKGDDRDLTSITWSPDGTLVAVGCYDCILRIYDAQGKGYLVQQQQEKGPIFSVRFSPSGRWLLSASLDGSACLWDVKEKRLHEQYHLHKDCCLDVDWLSDSQFVTSGSDGVINIMRVDSSKPVKQLVGHEHEVNQVKCNPSRTRIASCSDDMTGRIWNIEDVDSSRAVDDHPLVLSGHTGPVSHIAWAPITVSGEHDLVATSSFDGTSRLWDSVTGTCLCTFHDHKSNVYALAFSPDGRHFATGGADGWLYIYDVVAKQKRWSWYAGASQPSIFEIVWQQSGNLNRIAMAMERRTVGVVDLTRIPELQ